LDIGFLANTRPAGAISNLGVAVGERALEAVFHGGSAPFAKRGEAAWFCTRRQPSA